MGETPKENEEVSIEGDMSAMSLSESVGINCCITE
jgi:hypothetical protein